MSTALEADVMRDLRALERKHNELVSAAAAALKQRDEARATAERFRERFRKAEAAIARARKLMRAGRKNAPPLHFGDAYAALDWRQR